jgi:hypothetical protein
VEHGVRHELGGEERRGLHRVGRSDGSEVASDELASARCAARLGREVEGDHRA